MIWHVVRLARGLPMIRPCLSVAQSPPRSTSVFGLPFAWAIFGVSLLVVATGTARAQGKAAPPVVQESVERSFPSDFRTVFESLERVALDRDLSLKRSGGGGGWSGGNFDRLVKEQFAVVADEAKLPFMKDRGRILFRVGPPGDARPDSQLRTMTLDPDTGRLTAPEGIDLGGFKMHQISFRFSLTNANRQRICDVEMSRAYADEGLKVMVTGEGKDAPAVCRDVMASIESKLKLAAKRKEAREKRSRGSS